MAPLSTSHSTPPLRDVSATRRGLRRDHRTSRHIMHATALPGEQRVCLEHAYHCSCCGKEETSGEEGARVHRHADDTPPRHCGWVLLPNAITGGRKTRNNATALWHLCGQKTHAACWHTPKRSRTAVPHHGFSTIYTILLASFAPLPWLLSDATSTRNAHRINVVLLGTGGCLPLTPVLPSLDRLRHIVTSHTSTPDIAGFLPFHLQ